MCPSLFPPFPFLCCSRSHRRRRFFVSSPVLSLAAAIKALYKKFGKWHGISSLMNLVVLVCAVGHAYYLGAHLAF